MSIDLKVVLSQIDSALQRCDEIKRFSDHDGVLPGNLITEATTIISSTIERLAPHGSKYRENSDIILKKYGPHHDYSIELLEGTLVALRADYVAGYLKAIHELIHADIFSDFLEMADYLLKEGYKDPAAVIAGGVLEEHLRKLCQKNNIEIIKGDKYKNAEALNTELKSSNVYNLLNQKNVTAWLDLRNKAAHGKYNEYTKEQVSPMIMGIRYFISRYAA